MALSLFREKADPGSMTDVSRRRRLGHLSVVLAMTLLCTAAAPAAWLVLATSSPTPYAAPPPRHGYFALIGPGAWSVLPSDSECAARVHRSTWEPRPLNDKRNNTEPDPTAVHNALKARPRDTSGAYEPRWDSWLLPRVDGQFRGTTDEIFQWAACKWGLPDNVLRAIAVRESTWYQYPTYKSGLCVSNWGCGDVFADVDASTRTFCNNLARFGYDYQTIYGNGLCPKTYSIVGIMAWQSPEWGRMPGNQNGTFPFSRDSTAYAVDYLGAYLRGCYEGWEVWLAHVGNHHYGAGQLWGCVGSWYSGSWHDKAANEYIQNVKATWRSHTWLEVGWPLVGPGCSEEYGCIGPDPLSPQR